MTGVALNPDAFAAIRIEIQTVGGAKLSEMLVSHLRFYLNGDSQITYTLHELISNNALQVIVRGPQGSRAVALPENCLREVGFGDDEGLLPYDDRSFLGYRLLQEFFSFPEKFLFFDVHGFDLPSRAGWTDRMELIILLGEFGRRERLAVLERSVNADTFQLGCAPAVNLFQRQAEPIRVTEAETEYRDLFHRPRCFLPAQYRGTSGIPTLLFLQAFVRSRAGQDGILDCHAASFVSQRRQRQRGLFVPGRSRVSSCGAAGRVAYRASDLHEPRPSREASLHGRRRRF